MFRYNIGMKLQEMLSGIKACIFDMDGTLLDTELLMIHCWEKAAEKYGILGVVDVCHECIGTSSAETEHIFQKLQQVMLLISFQPHLFRRYIQKKMFRLISN